jgi:Cu-Zn family superoxide dismutase
MRRTVVSLLVPAFLLGAVSVAAGINLSPHEAKARLADTAGNPVGVVHLVEQGDAVLVRAVVEGLAAGFHGFHVHGVGSCVPPAFTSAGGHFNPGNGGHGTHAGDLPSLLVTDDGTALLVFRTDEFRVADLFDADGSSIIVHADRDNFANIPARYGGPDATTLATGDAGARFGCGVVG